MKQIYKFECKNQGLVEVLIHNEIYSKQELDEIFSKAADRAAEILVQSKPDVCEWIGTLELFKMIIDILIDDFGFRQISELKKSIEGELIIQSEEDIEEGLLSNDKLNKILKHNRAVEYSLYQ